jgi:hypothetical protein
MNKIWQNQELFFKILIKLETYLNMTIYIYFWANAMVDHLHKWSTVDKW